MEIKLYVSKVSIAIPEHMSKVQGDKLGKFAAMTFKKIQDPYVPMQTGNLANGSVMIKPWAIWHHTVYAHYQYVGDTFNHNRPGQVHPKATSRWDTKAYAEHKGEFNDAIQKYIDSGALGFGR